MAEETPQETQPSKFQQWLQKIRQYFQNLPKEINEFLDGKGLALPLLLLILLLGTCLVVSSAYKQSWRDYLQQRMNVPPVVVSPTPFQALDFQWEKQKVVELEKQRDEYCENHKRLNDELKLVNDRLFLMTVINNHNVYASLSGKGNHIYISSDWTIDQLPTNVSLNAEMREFLSQFVK